MFRWFKNVQDPISSYTHFLGACFGVIATLVFIAAGVANQRPLKTILACCVFSASMIALYSASSYYHTLSWDHPHHTLFRKLDHSMIYVLIAGTYTPAVSDLSAGAGGNYVCGCDLDDRTGRHHREDLLAECAADSVYAAVSGDGLGRTV